MSAHASGIPAPRRGAVRSGRRLPASERRRALIEAALTVVAQRGVAGASTRAIVAEAGMPLASFHYVFASRDALLAELILTVLAGEEEALAPAAAGAGLRETLRQGLELYFRRLAADPLREKAMFELAHYALRTPGMERLALAQYDRYRSLARSQLARVEALTDSRWSVPLDDVAVVLVALIDGLTTTWLVDRDDRRAALVMDAAADTIARFAEEG